MYSLLASRIGESEMAYELYLKSASIDLSNNQKLYAGGIYIGGTHPAASGGAYIDYLEGFLGMKVNKGAITFNPNLPKEIKDTTIRYLENDKVITKEFKL